MGKISQTKLEANRKNALASTGPRTPEGKATVAKNGLKHGIMSDHVVIKNGDYLESEEDFATLVEALRENFDVSTAMEELLCHRLAKLIWRQRRLERFEVGIISRKFDQGVDKFNRQRGVDSLIKKHSVSECSEENKANWMAWLERMQQLSFPDEKEIKLICRYEAMLSREMYRAIAALMTLKGKRKDRPCHAVKTIGRQDKMKNPEVDG